MKHQTSVGADDDGWASPARSVLAVRSVLLIVVVTIIATFVEVALNPRASFSVIHFWLALFLAVATRGDRDRDSSSS